MDLSTLANVATALTVLIAVAFGLMEARRARQERAERAAFTAVQALLTPEWMKSMIVVHDIRDGSSASEIESDARVLAAVQAVGVTLEGIGYSVFARIVPLHVVADLMGGTVRLAWRKVRPYVEEERHRSNSQKLLNGFSGLRFNSSGIRREKRVSRSERTRPTKTGSRRNNQDLSDEDFGFGFRRPSFCAGRLRFKRKSRKLLAECHLISKKSLPLAWVKTINSMSDT